MGYDEAATVLAVPVGTVRSRLARARIALRKLTADAAETDTVLPFPARSAADTGNEVRRLAA